MGTQDQIVLERKKKFEEWQKLGFGYASKFDRTHNSVEAKKEVGAHAPREVAEVLASPKNDKKMCGRIVNLRDMGKLAFLRLRDTEGDFQICLSQNVLKDKYKTFLKILDLGDFCGFSGEFFITRHGEPTLLAAEVHPLAKTLRPLPEKFHGLTDKEQCYRERYLDLMANEGTLNRFKIRSHVVREIRNFLESHNFQEVETRSLQQQAGGAMARVFETHHNDFDHNFVLRIALELDLKMAIGGGFERVFEIGKCFRNEGSDPSHLQEFTMLEWYAAYQNLDWNMMITEKMIQTVLQKVLGKTKLNVFDKDEKPVEIDFGKPFHQAKFPDLLKKFAKVDMFSIKRPELEKEAAKWDMSAKDIKKASVGTLLDHINKKSARPNLIEPTFVLDYPSELKPLARPRGDGTAEVFQLLIAGWEIVNSYGELIDPQIQRKLLEEQSAAKAAGDEETMSMDEEFLSAMEHGFPPMTGFGMGIDRFVTLITEQTNLRDTVLFPLMKPEGNQGGLLAPSKGITLMAAVVLNKASHMEMWQEKNAVAHLAAALGARIGKSLFYQDSLSTKDNQKINFNISHAIMIHEAKSGKEMFALLEQAKKAGLEVEEFIREMIITSDDKKVMEMARAKNHEDIEYLGILVFGKKSVVEKLTKEFPLVK